MPALLFPFLLAAAAALLIRSPRLPAVLAARCAAGAPAAAASIPQEDGISDPALLLELAGAMLESGAPLSRILGILADVAARPWAEPLRSVAAALAIGLDWDAAWAALGRSVPELRVFRDALGFAAATGAPSASLLYSEAARVRRRRQREAERRAAALGVQLVLPLGLCALPAFICLGVVPVLLSLLPGWLA
ncbi:type II secretion system F family protein [Paenarthrobacter sp. DKR-5]|uniref:type II secretion system F family protein n=1 Tax=Paenarthrobacter sp. DKR-5 TaxID=2835535 RepID=UPI001BDCDC1D|nr:type II secretion system F family protein [Paenarthrobacter sp. DKR-5]MBT1001335.1 type II secretion system F family protein [Paenarthrobacter sp. DKR-5]